MNLAEALNCSAARAHLSGRAHKAHMTRLMRAYGWGSTYRKQLRRKGFKAPEPKMRPYKIVNSVPQMTKKPWTRRALDFLRPGGQR